MCSTSVCEDFVKSVLSKNESLRNLFKEDHGKVKITCRKCDSTGVEGNARAFLVDNPAQIVLCTNRLQPQDIEEVLIHESVHAYDLFRNRCDFNSCDGLAYSEVRAARDAECRDSFFLFRDSCIKKAATRSTANLFSNAEQCVEKVFVEAMKDLAPFDQKIKQPSPVVDTAPVITAAQSSGSMPYSSLFGPPRKGST